VQAARLFCPTACSQQACFNISYLLMFNLIRHILFLLFILEGGVVYAQSGIVRGRAIDEATQQGIAFATVALFSTDSSFVKGELTDSTGHFEISGITEGNYYLEIRSLEYKKVSKSHIEINSRFALYDSGDFLLIPDTKLLNEVIVKGEKPAFEKHFDKTIINVSSNSFFRTSANANDVLRRSPGIRVTSQGGISLRNHVSPMVLIDGKPLPMSAEELNNYLNSLMQDQIESIEIIENPSARYDGEYKGVINIKLKRDKNLGWNGNVSAYGIRNSFNSAGAGATINYKSKKLSYYGSYWYNENRYHYKNLGTQFIENEKEELRSYLSIPREKKTHSYQFGTDYVMSKTQTLGILYKGFKNAADNTSSNLTKVFGVADQKKISEVTTENIQKPVNNDQTLNASYRGEFGNQKLSGDASYADYNSSQNQDISNFEANSPTERLRNLTESRIKIKSAQIDYLRKAGSGNVEIGIKAAQTNSYNNLLFDTLSKDNVWIGDIRRSTAFRYKENIFAGYISYAVLLGKKLNIQTGFRGENTRTNGNALNDNQTISREYFKILPNVKLGYQFNENVLLALSYSRRIERPSFYYLNPFLMYLSPYMYTEGNPFLYPTINNLAGLSFTFKDLGSNIGYRKDLDIVSQIPYLDPITNITLYTRENTGNRTNLSWDISYPVTVNRWWKLQHYFNLNYTKQDVPYLEAIHKVRQWAYSFNGSTIFIFKKSLSVELSYGYNSKSRGFIYDVGSTYQIDFALQKSILRNAVNIQLSLEDLFFTSNPKISSNVGNFKSEFYQTYDNRNLKIQLTYKFGKSVFQRREKRSSSADEENRAKN